jgi:pyruvate,water dikinase
MRRERPRLMEENRSERIEATNEVLRRFASGQTGKDRLAQESETMAMSASEGGNAVASGPARVLEDPTEIEAFRHGEVLVTEITDPDWEPIIKASEAPRRRT